MGQIKTSTRCLLVAAVLGWVTFGVFWLVVGNLLAAGACLIGAAPAAVILIASRDHRAAGN